VNKCPRVRLVNNLCDLHEPLAIVRIAKTVPEHDGERSRDFGFPSGKCFLSRECEGSGHCSEDGREGDDVHVCRTRWNFGDDNSWQFKRRGGGPRPA